MNGEQIRKEKVPFFATRETIEEILTDNNLLDVPTAMILINTVLEQLAKKADLEDEAELKFRVMEVPEDALQEIRKVMGEMGAMDVGANEEKLGECQCPSCVLSRKTAKAKKGVTH